jgi:hypothetical protein
MVTWSSCFCACGEAEHHGGVTGGGAAHLVVARKERGRERLGRGRERRRQRERGAAVPLSPSRAQP